MNALPAIDWKLPVAALLGAALCYPLASCQGRRSAEASSSAKIIAASAKVTEAAAKAEIAAMAVDAVRRGQAKQVQDELQEIVDERGTNDAAGPAVTGVLDRLRKADRR